MLSLRCKSRGNGTGSNTSNSNADDGVGYSDGKRAAKRTANAGDETAKGNVLGLWLGGDPVSTAELTQDDSMASVMSMDELDGFSPSGITIWEKLEEGAADISRFRGTVQELRGKRRSSTPAEWKGWKDFWGQVMYTYFNWRQDTFSDLQLIVALNLAVMVGWSLLRRVFVDVKPPEGVTDLWKDLYSVIALSFGQDFPDVDLEPVPGQVFSVVVSVFGVCAFALVLALVEQAVLELLENNVKRGSQVYERDHTLILGWCSSQRDLEEIWKILQQICHAYRNDGGTTVVVLTQREKLDMEQICRKYVRDRYGTQFVFRQGSPLIPADLEMVASPHAAATIIVSDHARSAEEADAQGLRCAVLLDEKHRATPEARQGHVVVEMKTPAAIALLRLACSRRIVALPTSALNARRMSHMVKHPIQSVVSQTLLSFTSPYSMYIESYPELFGTPWAEAAFRFPHAVLVGLSCSETGTVRLNPPVQTVIGPTDDLILIRPTNIRDDDFIPLTDPVKEYFTDQPATTNGTRATAAAADKARGDTLGALTRGDLTSEFWDARDSVTSEQRARIVEAARSELTVPLEYITVDDNPARVLVCNWGEASFMATLLREFDSGTCRLPPGSEVLLVNSHEWEDTLARVMYKLRLEHISVTHLMADPLDIAELSGSVDMTRVQCAIVLCDARWFDPDENASNGFDIMDLPSFLRLDSLSLMVQLNIVQLLKEQGLPPLSIFGQKMATQGTTRFEDRSRLPLGIGLNFTSYAAKLLATVAYNPKVLLPLAKLSDVTELTFVDASEYADLGERMNFWQLVKRSQLRQEVLLGYYVIPRRGEEQLHTVLNPDAAARERLHTWNKGDQRLKLVIMKNKDPSHWAATPTKEITRYFGTGGVYPPTASTSNASVEAAQDGGGQWVAAAAAGSSIDTGNEASLQALTALAKAQEEALASQEDAAAEGGDDPAGKGSDDEPSKHARPLRRAATFQERETTRAGT